MSAVKTDSTEQVGAQAYRSLRSVNISLFFTNVCFITNGFVSFLRIVLTTPDDESKELKCVLPLCYFA